MTSLIPPPPIAGYETTVLYGLARPMLPHAFRWKAQGAIPSRIPTGQDFSPQGKPKRTAPAPKDTEPTSN